MIVIKLSTAVSSIGNLQNIIFNLNINTKQYIIQFSITNYIFVFKFYKFYLLVDIQTVYYKFKEYGIGS